MSRGALLLTLAMLVVPAAASAQPVVDLALGTTHNGKAGSKIDFYRFGGESGTTIKATLAAPGESALILYSADGVEMLSARGTGKVTLDAILPLWSSYLIGVIRKDGSRPYVLGINGQRPDDHLAIFSHGVGYVWGGSDQGGAFETCWIEPGVKLRRLWSKGIEEITIGRGGKEFGVWTPKNGKSRAIEREVRFEGTNVVYHRTDGSQRDITMAFDDLVNIDDLQHYSSYLCPG